MAKKGFENHLGRFISLAKNGDTKCGTGTQQKARKDCKGQWMDGFLF
jgi:hypothetical protein